MPNPTFDGSLAEEFHRYFDSGVRRRGESYARAGLVDLLSFEDGIARAKVGGTRVYAVELDVADDGDRAGHCSCPAYERELQCKHVWALVLVVDALDAENDPLRELGQHAAELRTAEPDWVHRVQTLVPQASAAGGDPWRALTRFEEEIRYSIDIDATVNSGVVNLRLALHRRKKNGEWDRGKTYSPSRKPAWLAADRKILATLAGAGSPWSYRYDELAHSRSDAFALGREMCTHLLPELCATGRLYWRRDRRTSTTALIWDDGPPWRLSTMLQREAKTGEFVLEPYLERDQERMELTVPELLHAWGYVIAAGHVARLDSRDSFPLVADYRENGPLRASSENEEVFLQGLRASRLPVLEEVLEPDAIAAPPTPCLYVLPERDSGRGARRLDCRIRFDYGGKRLEPGDDRRLIHSESSPTRRRDFEFEREALRDFLESGGLHTTRDRHEERDGAIPTRRLAETVRALVGKGWRVEAEGQVWRSAGSTSVSVRSGIDWFELEGGIEFDDQVANLPALLEAAREGSHFVRLGDGSVGLLPEDWLRSWGLLELAGEVDDDRLRFPRQQGWILDALLAEREGVRADAGFQRLRQKLARFEIPSPKQEPKGFCGELRAYQRAGLGWFAFLRDHGLGGCLADDMGLGKTVQVLAMLESRRRASRQPSIVVAPRSVVFNWLEEAERFAPRLKTLDFTGTDRHQRLAEAGRVDLLVTTYGTLRRDAPELADRRFDYAVLDEAQAIKNASSQAAKAARLLVADHRLALSGTPIENHLGELWSLLEFLNPGMLGRSRAFQSFVSSSGRGTDNLAPLARAVRPMFLRRTKAEVLDDLPAKTEQTLLCEFSGREQRDYESLLDHYRAALLGRESEGELGRMKIQVLEALLRLRQAACHPGLLDPARGNESSAKLDALLPMLEEVVESGHKALVFSQFTKLLAILRARLGARGIPYEYLDGRTRKRQDKVERFQSDPDCPLFLISLKAGGQGLNLTAADYVFLLDPWWNPAVESQAIDRAHRIGQTRPVSAYRLITRGTVEEKVLELQNEKRELAAAVLGEGSFSLKDLTRADLERILA